MKIRCLSLVAVLGVSALPLTAQPTNELESLKLQLKQAQDSFEKAMREHRQAIESINQRIQTLEQQQAGPPAPGARPASVPTNAVVASPSPPPRAVAEAPMPAATPPASVPIEPRKPWSPTDPITIVGGQRNYLNLSFDALFALGGSTANDIPVLEPGGHDPNQNGFTVQNLETVFEGKVDPYFRAQASLVGHLDSNNEFHFEAEEAYGESLSLPLNLQLKAGLYLTEFGRLNPTHPHTWNFVDVSLVNARMFGPDGLRNPGARVSWLMPTPFYSELFLSVQDSEGDAAYSFCGPGESDGLFFERQPIDWKATTVGDMLYVPRYTASFDLTESQTILLGGSGAFGPNNTGQDTRTQIYGLDLFWKWKPVNQHGGFPFVSLQTEAMWRSYEAGQYSNDSNRNGILDPWEQNVYGDGSVRYMTRETLKDWGVYSQVAWGFKKGWVAAFRGDYVTPQKLGEYELNYGPDPTRAVRWRLSPNLTWYPSEFSKIRLQYNYDYRDHIGPDHSVWLQFEVLLGSHAAHKF